MDPMIRSWDDEYGVVSDRRMAQCGSKACPKQVKSGSGKTEAAFQPASPQKSHTPSCHDLIMASIPLPIQEQRPSKSHWNATRRNLKRNGVDPMIKSWDDEYGVFSHRWRRLAHAHAHAHEHEHDRAAMSFIHNISTACQQLFHKLPTGLDTGFSRRFAQGRRVS